MLLAETPSRSGAPNIACACVADHGPLRLSPWSSKSAIKNVRITDQSGATERNSVRVHAMVGIWFGFGDFAWSTMLREDCDIDPYSE
jgi:hypothetical protein